MTQLECTKTMEQLDVLTRTGLEPDTWTGARLAQAIADTRLVLLLDFPRQEIWRGDRLASVLLARREAWFVSKQMTVQQEARLSPCLFENPASLKSTTWGNMEAGSQWYAATRYHITPDGRFANCGYGQMLVETLAGWLDARLADITASFDEALDFLLTRPH